MVIPSTSTSVCEIGGKQYYLWRAVDQDGEVKGSRARYAPNQIDCADAALLSTHVAVHNLFTLSRHLVSASHYRDLRQTAFESWEKAVAS